MTGTIKTLVRDRGFGFIAREGQAKDLFFHSNDLSGVAFDELKVEPVIHTDGDSYARCFVRCNEIFQSIALVRQALEKLESADEA